MAIWIFFIAAIYGLPLLLLSYISPATATGGVPLTQPDFYYGFPDVPHGHAVTVVDFAAKRLLSELRNL